MDPVFVKTGGGEDLDFCLRQSRHLGLPFHRVRDAVVVHPWWDATSKIAYFRHFWKWTTGDGHLIAAHPDHVYLNYPNVVELSLVTLLCAPRFPISCLIFLGELWIVEVLSETIRALRGPESTHLSPLRRVAAAFVSCAVKNVVDVGHTFFHIRRGRLFLCWRFDWFAGFAHHASIDAERRKFARRCAIWALALALTITGRRR